jgi:YidC/Oxa1 family membrane protein insertase
MGAIFLGFTIYSNREQQRYQQELEAYQAEHPELFEQNTDAPDEASRTPELTAEEEGSLDSLRIAREKSVLGDVLAEAKNAPAEYITVDNDVLRLIFSTRGGIVQSAELKEYTRYAEGDRNEQVRLFVPESSSFDLSFFVKSGLNNLKINTSDYTFQADAVIRTDTAQIVRMRLPIIGDASLEYTYTIYNQSNAARDYLVDYTVRLVNLTPYMVDQSSIGLSWSNTSYQNERGFKNENTYTTIAYRTAGATSIDDLSMSEGAKQKSVSKSVDWVAFKQQFFSSAFIARDPLLYADLSFDTQSPTSGLIKSFSAEMAVPYNAQTSQYDFAFYFGPNKYAVLKHITDSEGNSLLLDRLIPMGWGIIGWVSRWIVIPVFDFLRQYIASFGWIILILAILIKLIVSPLTYRSYLSQAKMRIIKPEMDALNAKYPKQEDAMKKQQEMMALYKKAGINPMGGCIPMLIQFPILIAMFRFFPSSIELRGESFWWAGDLSSYDSIVNLPFSIPFYGDHVSLFALLMALSTFAFSYMSYQQTASAQPQMAGMKFMMVYMMPIFMLCWFNGYSSGLCYYYLLFNLLTIVQTVSIRRMVDDTKIRAIMEANANKAKNRKKSKFQLRYEELMRQQEAMQKSNRNRQR